MPPSDPLPAPRRRRIIVLGAVALIALYAAGALVMVPWIGRDLGGRVIGEVQADGVTRAVFKGQDGTLYCDQPLADPAAVLARAEGVRGVHAITLDASCGDPSVPATTTTVAPSTTEAPTTTAAPSTTEAPTTTAAPTTTTVTWPLLAVWLDGGVIALTGAVANEDQRAQLVAAAGEAVTPANVSDQLLVDGTSTISDDLVIALGELATAMPAGLVAGTAAFDGTTIAVQGTYASDDLRAQFEAAAAEVPGVVVTLQPRPTATAEQAAALEAELNALVAAEPILFDKGSTTISDASQSTLVKVAGLAERYAGVAIQVQGHTDSEGDAGRNLTLSEDRAAAVLDALVALGVPAADLTAAGFGETELIVGPDGKEDPVASRRVVFAVVVRQP
ncbi:MAG: OmpA family protein [Acidimicrobiaceae bacterium]|nr:OmpA family protein [Acidimicrobiaceae bacterium]